MRSGVIRDCGMNIGKWCRLPFLGMAALVMLSGCANQQKVESPELLSAEARNEAVKTSTRYDPDRKKTAKSRHRSVRVLKE